MRKGGSVRTRLIAGLLALAAVTVAVAAVGFYVSAQAGEALKAAAQDSLPRSVYLLQVRGDMLDFRGQVADIVAETASGETLADSEAINDAQATAARVDEKLVVLAQGDETLGVEPDD